MKIKVIFFILFGFIIFAIGAIAFSVFTDFNDFKSIIKDFNLFKIEKIIIYLSIIVVSIILSIKINLDYGKFLSYIESLDFKKTIDFLDRKIFDQKKIKPLYIKYYLVVSAATQNIEKIKRLENLVYKQKKRIFKEFAPSFSASYLYNLSGDLEELYAFIIRVKNEFKNKLTKIDPWIRFEEGFYFLVKRDDNYKAIFYDLVRSENRVVVMLVLFLLSSNLKDGENNVLGPIIQKFKKENTEVKIENAISREMENSCHTVFLRNLILNAKNFLYKKNAN